MALHRTAPQVRLTRLAQNPAQTEASPRVLPVGDQRRPRTLDPPLLWCTNSMELKLTTQWVHAAVNAGNINVSVSHPFAFFGCCNEGLFVLSRWFIFPPARRGIRLRPGTLQIGFICARLAKGMILHLSPSSFISRYNPK